MRRRRWPAARCSAAPPLRAPRRQSAPSRPAASDRTGRRAEWKPAPRAAAALRRSSRCWRAIHSSSVEGCNARIASRPTGDAANPATSASSGSHSSAARSACSTGDGMGSRSGIVSNYRSVPGDCDRKHRSASTRSAGRDQLLVDFGVAAGVAGVEAAVEELPLSAAGAFVSDFVSDLVSDFVSDFRARLAFGLRIRITARRAAL